MTTGDALQIYRSSPTEQLAVIVQILRQLQIMTYSNDNWNIKPKFRILPPMLEHRAHSFFPRTTGPFVLLVVSRKARTFSLDLCLRYDAGSWIPSLGLSRSPDPIHWRSAVAWARPEVECQQCSLPCLCFWFCWLHHASGNFEWCQVMRRQRPRIVAFSWSNLARYERIVNCGCWMHQIVDQNLLSASIGVWGIGFHYSAALLSAFPSLLCSLFCYPMTTLTTYHVWISLEKIPISPSTSKWGLRVVDERWRRADWANKTKSILLAYNPDYTSTTGVSIIGVPRGLLWKWVVSEKRYRMH